MRATNTTPLSLYNKALKDHVYLDELLSSMGDIGFKLEDFNFDLPEHYINKFPRPERSSGRLMQLSKNDGQIVHSQVHHLIDFIEEGDLMVFNDTLIIPSSLTASTSTGQTIDLFVERILSENLMLARLFRHPKLEKSDQIWIGNYELQIVDQQEQFFELVLKDSNHNLWDIIYSRGELAFPTYFGREATQTDKQRFQTIYAKEAGSVSAPSAGFHFDDQMFEKIKNKGISVGYLTLHVGSGTSAPIHVDDISKHKMHTEWFTVSPQLAELVRETKARGKRVIAVGTTSLRGLESASQSGQIEPYSGYTNIFIRPGYQFQCIDGLFTNLHLPKSTLMILISALAGFQHIRKAYQVAIAEQYRFLAFGDGMLIL